MSMYICAVSCSVMQFYSVYVRGEGAILSRYTGRVQFCLCTRGGCYYVYVHGEGAIMSMYTGRVLLCLCTRGGCYYVYVHGEGPSAHPLCTNAYPCKHPTLLCHRRPIGHHTTAIAASDTRVSLLPLLPLLPLLQVTQGCHCCHCCHCCKCCK